MDNKYSYDEILKQLKKLDDISYYLQEKNKEGKINDFFFSFESSDKYLFAFIKTYDELISLYKEKTREQKTKKDNPQMIANKVLEFYKAINENGYYCGEEKIAKYLCGKKVANFKDTPEIRDKYFGCYFGMKPNKIKEIIELMIEKEIMVHTNSTRYPTLRIKSSIIGNIKLNEVKTFVEKKSQEQKDKEEFKKLEKLYNKETGYFENEYGEILTDLELYKILKRKKKEIAIKNRCKEYQVSSDKMLAFIATFYVKTKEEYLKIPYYKEEKYIKSGQYLVETVRQYLKTKEGK